MAWLKRESPYERRIRELEDEAERVRKNMQQLMKQVPREGTPVRTSTPSVSGQVYRQTHDPRVASSAVHQEPVYDSEEDGEDTPLLSYLPGSTIEQDAPEPSIRPQRPVRSSSSSYNRSEGEAGGQARTERLASYLASGSFGKSRPLSHERRIERNKAIMMLLFALLALYSLITWMK